jgi:hypothetical protein
MLRDDIGKTKIHRGSRKEMRKAGVNLKVLEQLVGRILHDRSIPSSTESFPSTRSSPPFQRHQNTHQLRGADSLSRYGSSIERPQGVYVSAIESENRRPVSHQARPLAENWSSGEPPRAIDIVPSENQLGYEHQPHYPELEHQHQPRYPALGHQPQYSRLEYQPCYSYEPIPAARDRISTGMPRTVRVFPGETEEFGPRQNEVFPIDNRQRHRQLSPHRHEDHAASEQTPLQRRDPEARGTKRRSSSYSSGNERVAHQIQTLEGSLSTNRNEEVNEDLPRLPIQRSERNSRQSRSSQRRESDLVSERTPSERGRSNIMRSSQRHSNQKTDNRQAEQQLRSRGRSTSTRTADTFDEIPRHRLPDSNISGDPLPSNVYHEQVPERHRSKSRSGSSSMSRNFGTGVRTNTNRNTESVHEPPHPQRVNMDRESRPPSSNNCDLYPPDRIQTTLRSGPPSLKQGFGVHATTNNSRSASRRTASVDNPSVPRRSDGNIKSRQPLYSNLDPEPPQKGQQTSRRSSLSSTSNDSGICGSSDLVHESSARQRPSRIVNDDPPTCYKSDEERPRRRTKSSRTRSSSRSYDSGVGLSNSLSDSSDIVPESRVYQRPKRVASRYPPISYKFDEERPPRRNKSSKRRSSSRT